MRPTDEQAEGAQRDPAAPVAAELRPGHPLRSAAPGAPPAPGRWTLLLRWDGARGVRQSFSRSRNRLMSRQSATAPSRAPSRKPTMTRIGVGAQLLIQPATSQRTAQGGHEEDEADLREEGEVCECLPVTVHRCPERAARSIAAGRGRPGRPSRQRRCDRSCGRAPSSALQRVLAAGRAGAMEAGGAGSSSGYELASRASSAPERKVSRSRSSPEATTMPMNA